MLLFLREILSYWPRQINQEKINNTWCSPKVAVIYFLKYYLPLILLATIPFEVTTLSIFLQQPQSVLEGTCDLAWISAKVWNLPPSAVRKRKKPECKGNGETNLTLGSQFCCTAGLMWTGALWWWSVQLWVATVWLFLSSFLPKLPHEVTVELHAD